MAYKLIWSPISRDDLHNIVRFISRDNPPHAQKFALRLIARTDILRNNPEIGRVVPEYRFCNVREIIFRPYRIVYRVLHGSRTVEISRVWHAARGAPDLSDL